MREGYGTWFVCLSVCLFVCLFVCLLPLFLGDGKLVRRTEGTKRFGATLRSFIRTDFAINASFYGNGVICLPRLKVPNGSGRLSAVL